MTLKRILQIHKNNKNERPLVYSCHIVLLDVSLRLSKLKIKQEHLEHPYQKA